MTKYWLMQSHAVLLISPSLSLSPFYLLSAAMDSLESENLVIWNLKNLYLKNQKIWHTPSDTKSLWRWCCNSSSLSKIFPLSNVSSTGSLIRGAPRCRKSVVTFFVNCHCRMSVSCQFSKFWQLALPRQLSMLSKLFQTLQQNKLRRSSWPTGRHLDVFPWAKCGPVLFVMFMSDWDRWHCV